MQPLISLCIPTNGITEWVIPVLDSIYAQNVNDSEFEVVVTDNGDNQDFKAVMHEYALKHNNLVYQENKSYMFYNQLEALKLGNGEYLKFINHRAPLTDGSLKKLISIISENKQERPTLYFSNGVLKQDLIDCNSFDAFVSELGIYASWTTGVGIWKEEFDRIKDNLLIDKISPHSCILFSRRKDELYRIYNFVFSCELTSDHSKKGTYDLFKAFGVEELSITQNLYINGDISVNTFKKVKKQYGAFVSRLYFDFCIKKDPCSYDLSGFNNAMGIYFYKFTVIMNAYLYGVKRIFGKIIKFI